MKLHTLPRVVVDMIIGNLTIKDMVSLSRVNKAFNLFCKEKKTDLSRNFFTMTGENGILEIFPENYLPRLKLTNYQTVANAWKNIIFFLLINNDKFSQLSILYKKIPKNIMVSVVGISSLNVGSIHPSLEILDCPWKIMNCPKEISHTLKYLNISEQFYIPSHLDFSGRSLISLNMSMSRLNSHRFNFSRTLKIVNMFGCTGVKNLEGFEYVESLNMDYCDQIESVEPLKNIVKLSMRHCHKIKDVSSLTRCENLDISFTNISDISNLKKLKKVYLTGIDKMVFNVSRHDIIHLS